MSDAKCKSTASPPIRTEDVDCLDSHRSAKTDKRKAAFQAWHQKKLAEMQISSTELDDDLPPQQQKRQQQTLVVQQHHQQQQQQQPQQPLQKQLLQHQQLLQGQQQQQQRPQTLHLQQQHDHQHHQHVRPQQLNRTRSSAENHAIGQQSGDESSSPLSTTARELTVPKLSRHNDAAYYPNIQCVLCHEWVCSRNRYMHIESHLQYRPYKCSICGYDNRKEIFIHLHISRVHKGMATVQYTPDAELEKRAWLLAEQCLQHTREVLLRRKPNEEEASSVDGALLAPYNNVYRPKIYNNQRIEKSNLIEESRMLGLIPDFKEVTTREEQCSICHSHVLRTQALLEEHVRVHMSQPTYLCVVDNCLIRHHSRQFVTRHMKEVHRMRQSAYDLLEYDLSLLDEYVLTCEQCFPKFFDDRQSLERVRMRFVRNLLVAEEPGVKRKLTATVSTPTSTPTVELLLKQTKSMPVAPDDCASCVRRLSLFFENCSTDGDDQCALCRAANKPADTGDTRLVFGCRVCQQLLTASFDRPLDTLEAHSLSHAEPPPFACSLCSFAHWRPAEVSRHVTCEHPALTSTGVPEAVFRWQSSPWRQVWTRIFDKCFGRSTTTAAAAAASTERCCVCDLCQVTVCDDVQIKLDHVTAKHVGSVQSSFRCPYCNFGSLNLDQVAVHVAVQHVDRPVTVGHSIPAGCSAQTLYKRCFPEPPPLPKLQRRPSQVAERQPGLMHLLYHLNSPSSLVADVKPSSGHRLP